METEWMGRYRELVRSLVTHSNIVVKSIPEKIYIDSTNTLSIIEWQVLEYLVENEGSNEKMIAIADRLGIKQSSFSKAVSSLARLNLVEKYQFKRNRKDVILKPSPEGKELYGKLVQQNVSVLFKPFFKELEDVDDESIAKMAKAIDALNNSMIADIQPTEDLLIKID